MVNSLPLPALTLSSPQSPKGLYMFEISADNLCWINGNTDDPEDLCAHGNVKVKIGDESYEYYCTVSAAALYLLKSIT